MRHCSRPVQVSTSRRSRWMLPGVGSSILHSRAENPNRVSGCCAMPSEGAESKSIRRKYPVKLESAHTRKGRVIFRSASLFHSAWIYWCCCGCFTGLADVAVSPSSGAASRRDPAKPAREFFRLIRFRLSAVLAREAVPRQRSHRSRRPGPQC